VVKRKSQEWKGKKLKEEDNLRKSGPIFFLLPEKRGDKKGKEKSKN